MSKLLLEATTLEDDCFTSSLLLDLASEEEGFTEELEVFSSSRELEEFEAIPLSDEDWESVRPLEAGMTEEEEDFDFSTEEEDVSEPAEVTVEEEISATGSEDAVLALVLSSQAVRKQSAKAKRMNPIALEFIPDLFLSAPG